MRRTGLRDSIRVLRIPSASGINSMSKQAKGRRRLMEKAQAKSPRAPGSEPFTALDVWREACAIIHRYPLATIVPAVVLGASAEALALIGDSVLVDETLTNLATAFAYYLYVAYAEEVVESARAMDNASSLGRLLRTWQVFPIALRMLVASTAFVGIVVASIVMVGLTAAAATEVGVADIVTGLLFLLLLLLLGLWLLTRLSLFAPALSRERLGPLAAIKRSNELTRGHLWLVFWTATLAFLLEGLTDEPVALAAELGFGSWGEWIGGSMVTALVMPLAAVTTSLAYHRLLVHNRRLSSEAPQGEEHVGGEDSRSGHNRLLEVRI